jgi:N-acetylglucosaminyldiphosphoundecaprenol N-acetyl-beta-D-mannosaminyltransferase
MPDERVKIMEIPFDRITQEDALALLLKKLLDPLTKRFFVATPNPEMLLEAQKNPPFKKILQHTDLNIPDGTGVIWASRLNGTPLPERVTGTDLMENLCAKILPETKVFLLGGGRNVAEKVKTTLESRRKISITGTHSGSASPADDGNIRKLIDAAAPDLLFVAFGAPKQELWLARNLPHLHSVKVAMGVGGAFDFIAGEKKRAPLWMRKTGLEWLFRLIRQPSRIGRIFNATVVFPFVFIRRRLRGLE